MVVKRKIKVCVYGLGHLGQVTSACLAEIGINVLGLGTFEIVNENGLQDLFVKNEKKIDFVHHYPDVSDVDYLWVTFDTPVKGEDKSNVEFVKHKIDLIVPCISKSIPIIISSQLPVGTIKQFEKKYPGHSFACVPENLRHGTAIKNFLEPDRIVVGTRKKQDRTKYSLLFSKITNKIEWMTTESAEMTKHAINAFLATSITFANELGDICESKCIDYNEVLRGLLTEERIGPKARLRAGSAYTGKTLARDIKYLIDMSNSKFFRSIKNSNDKRLKK